jgi:glycosyltransferase involved in cell wall biosynthesis
MIRRVLQLSALLSVFGVSQYMRILGRGLMERGIRVGIVALGTGEPPYDRAWYEERGFDVFLLPGRVPNYRRLTSLRAWRDLSRSLSGLNQAIDSFAPDVLHANSGLMAMLSTVGRPLRRNRGALVTCVHGDSQEADKLRMGRIAGRVLPGSFGRRTIAISSEMRDFVVGTIGIDARRVRTVFPCVDDRHFRPPLPEERIAARRALGVPEDAWVVSLVGQYEQRKGHDVLVDAAGIMRQRGTPITVLCAGAHHEAAAYKERLMRRAAERGVAERMILLGHSDTREVMWASDCGVLPSRKEGFGLVVVEGMACGVVQLRTPSAGARDTTIDGETGFVVPFDDPAAIADRLGELHADPALCARMAARSIEQARERFSAARMVADTLAVYEEAVGGT